MQKLSAAAVVAAAEKIVGKKAKFCKLNFLYL